MIIYAFLEHYPSPYKPYFDTQFEQFLRDGHTLRIYAFGRWSGPIAAKVGTLGLDRATSYLPERLRAIPRFVGPMLWRVLTAPVARVRGCVRALRSPQSLKQRLLAAVRSILLPRDPPDLCLVHNLITQRNVTFLRDLYPGVPVAMYYHGGEVPGVPVLTDSESRRAFASADVVFTNTEDSRIHAIARGCAAGRLMVSPVGFNLDDFQPPAQRTYRRNGFLNLVSIGRLSEEKGIRHSLEAMALLREAGVRDVRYRIIGDGPLGAEHRAYVETHGLGDSIVFLGAVPFGQLHDELTFADALLLPSLVVGTWQENQACVVQEAMLMHTLVATSTTGGVPESTAPELRQFGFAPADPAAIAQAVQRLRALTEPQLQALGHAGAGFARVGYDIVKLNAQLLTAATRSRASVRQSDRIQRATSSAQR